MIEHCKIKRLRPETRFRFCDIRNIDFKPGLNLLVGANTSGKSSILECIRRYYCYDNQWKYEQDFSYIKNKHLSLEQDLNVKITANLCQLIEYQPNANKNKESFDFLQTGTKEYVMSKFQSSGESNRNYHDWFVQKIINSSSDIISEEQLNYIKNANLIYNKNELVILADEPENSLAINLQFGLFDWFYNFCKINSKAQVIIATHSIAAFEMYKNAYSNINYIELTKGWLRTITQRIYG